MDKYMSEEEYNKKLADIRGELSELNQDMNEINSNVNNLQKTYRNIESAQEIINSIAETASVVNSTVNPLEFFEGYDKMYYLVEKLELIPDIEYSQQPPNEIREELEGQRKPAIQKMIERYYNYSMSMHYSIDIFYKTLSRYFPYMDDDHKNYINQLCKSGYNSQDENAEKIRKFKKIYLNFAYITNRILLPPAKIAFVVWTLLWFIGTRSFWQDIPVILLGYLIFCGIADLIYFANQKKYTNYKVKITKKKINRLKKLMQEIDPTAYQINYGNNISHQKEKTYKVNFDTMEGHQFEYFCADILRKNGFTNVEVTQGSGDHGIDILAEKDDITYAIQCKCYSSNIGNSAVQQAHTGKSLYHKDIAVVMTNRYFTQQAIEEAKTLGVKLWDRDKMYEMIDKR